MIKMICPICKKEFFQHLSQIKKNKTHFCSRECYAKSDFYWCKGKNHHSWKGGKRYRHGYIKILIPKHPFADSQGYVFEHRLVIEKHIGRYLSLKEEVHHINGIKDDNRIGNLIFNKKHSSHMNKYHRDKKNGRFINHINTQKTKSSPE